MVAELKFAVLGPMRAWRGDAELDLGSPQQRAVLAVLLLAGGRQVGVGGLIGAPWGGEPPRAASSTVRPSVSRRRAPPGGGGGEVIEAAGDGYALPLRSAVLDLIVFERLTTQARAAADAGDPGRAAGLLHEAQALWQGTPLAGIPGDYAASQRVRLTEQQ